MHVVNNAKGSGREKKFFLMYLSCDEYASLISNRRYEVKIQMSSDHVLKGRKDLRYPILTVKLLFFRNCHSEDITAPVDLIILLCKAT